ncbi:MAG: hypothetical protein KZQ83_05260 [gamma proteobacterium symbiont of Taylorina sp.]|nr:hypothetical protein [gamma proteobacterium symbiont of Taylorina sp.]
MNHKHSKILEKFFHHPISNDIQWNEVMKLFKGLGATIEVNKHSGKTNISLDELSIILPKQTHKLISNHKEVIALRHFLEQSGNTP